MNDATVIAATLTRRQRPALQILMTSERPLKNKDFHERHEIDGRRTTGWAKALGPCTKPRGHDPTSLWARGLVTVDHLSYAISDRGREVANVMGFAGNATESKSELLSEEAHVLIARTNKSAESKVGQQQRLLNSERGKAKLNILGQQARAAISCSYCFMSQRAEEWEHTPQRPSDRKDDVAVAPWVGPQYLDTTPRVAVMMLNPGSAAAPHKLKRKDFGHHLRDGSITYNQYNDALIELFPQWGFGAVDRWLQAIELQTETIAFLNMALCAVASDDYFPELFETCFERHTSEFLITLAPDVVLLCGKRELEPYANVIESLGANVILTWHYRPMNTKAGQAELERVRRKLDKYRQGGRGWSDHRE